MRIIIDETVHLSIESFYRAAMHNHITLTFETVENKKNRLYDSIADLRYYHKIYPKTYNGQMPDGKSSFVRTFILPTSPDLMPQARK